jgi:hypothetical protein
MIITFEFVNILKIASVSIFDVVVGDGEVDAVADLFAVVVGDGEVDAVACVFALVVGDGEVV